MVLRFLRTVSILMAASLIIAGLADRARPAALPQWLLVGYLGILCGSGWLALWSLRDPRHARAAATAFATWRAHQPWVSWAALGFLCGGLGTAGILLPRLMPGAAWTVRLSLAGVTVLVVMLLVFAGLEAKPFRARVRRLGFDALILAAVMLAVEGILRAALFRQDNILRSKDGIYYVGSEPLVSAGPFGDLPPGESVWLISDLRPYTVVVNRQGLRHIEDVDPDAIRILAVGDSFTFGPYVANEDTWPVQLESELRNAYPTTPIQVFNAGVAGYGIVQELSYLKEKGLALKPDLVILAFYPNDIRDMQLERQQLFQRPTRKSWDALAWLTRNTVLFHTVRSAVVKGMLARTKQKAIAVRDATPVEAQRAAYDAGYRAQFAEMAALLKRANIPFGVVAFPQADQVPVGQCPNTEGRFMKELAEAHNVPFLDLLGAFRQYRLDELYLFRYDRRLPLTSEGCFAERERYQGNGHPARFGYQVAARAIEPWLISLGVIPVRDERAR